MIGEQGRREPIPFERRTSLSMNGIKDCVRAGMRTTHGGRVDACERVLVTALLLVIDLVTKGYMAMSARLSSMLRDETRH